MCLIASDGSGDSGFVESVEEGVDQLCVFSSREIYEEHDIFTEVLD